jgi:protein-S-isoprenylcysteine O-methyltransferase Ste14
VRARRLAAALAAAAVCHVLFAAAVGSMAFALGTGLQSGLGRVPAPWSHAANLLLIAQFPLVHSFLLGARGRTLLARLVPGFGRTLRPTTFATLASLQLLLTFWAWTPSGVVLLATDGGPQLARWVLYALAWLFLQKALWDAGPMLQTGAAGWWALLRDRPVDHGPMPTGGLFRRCRQPIYLGFALVLWTAPTWTPDWLWLTLGWSAYCLLGPRRKEARWLALHGERFAEYRARVPYFLPRLLASRPGR